MVLAAYFICSMGAMSKCIFCRKCEKSCPTSAIITNKDAKTQTVIRHRCIACNTCVEVCPTQTISMSPPVTSDSRCRAAAYSA